METNETETQLATTVLNSKDRVEETPAMAPEIEQYLMSKFEKGLDVNAKGSSRIPFVSKFREIKTLLRKILCSTPRGNPSMREKLYSLNDLLVESQMLSEKHCIFFSPEDLVTMNNIRMKLNKIKTELKEMKVQRAASNGNIQQQPKNGSSVDTRISKPPETSLPPAAEIKVHGFDEDAIIVKKLLLSRTNEDGFKAIAIVGTKGIGKTTLSQMIFNKPEVKTHFLPRIWVSMSNDDNDDDDDDDQDPKRAIVKRMLISLGVEKKTVSESHGLRDLLFALYLQLVGKKYLIVLDDARDKDSWYEQLNSGGLADDKKCETRFGDGLPKGYGGRVIVTSRNEELAKTMVGEKNLHHLLPLTSKSCWAIFKDAVNDDTYNPPNVEDLQMEVKQKCGGIPLAAKMMGEMCSQQRQDEAE
ncbi:hypothetical protein FEM48_Zijuj01G0141000 [Ziziphus jujuba var. spinosa]|uniref:NB-ARC domain-containing protein n=1 Tax=Ziziphus jujuba var. spinosa TaxID=714518 RepID=A0A978W1Q1_ZIZJJ|nr:hypothetical protein FEM48_Zijuj01G0141000 [Ziziphus jujuba var. spinosa]